MAKKDDLAAAKAERDKALKAVQAEEKKAGNTNEYSQSYYDAKSRYNSAQRKLNELESASKPKAKPKARDPYTEVPGGQSSVAAARSVEERKKADKAAAEAAAQEKKAKLPDYEESADAIINGILSRAKTSDPTATRTVTNVNLSPLPSGGMSGTSNVAQGGEINVTVLQKLRQ